MEDSGGKSRLGESMMRVPRRGELSICPSKETIGIVCELYGAVVAVTSF